MVFNFNQTDRNCFNLFKQILEMPTDYLLYAFQLRNTNQAELLLGIGRS